VARAITDGLITEPEIAEAIGVSPRTVRRLAGLGFLTRVKVLGSGRYNTSEAAAIVEFGTRDALRAGVA
jgi:predicted transcriptional regulator of viral defense system